MGKYKNNKEERLSIYTYSTVQYVYVQCFIILFVFLDGGWKPESKRVAVFLASSSRRRAEGRGA